MNGIDIGDKVLFWRTFRGKRQRVIGIFKGRTYSGKAVVETGYGIEAYQHKVNYKNVRKLSSRI